MGRNLVLNLMDHGRTVAVFNRTAQRTRSFAEGEASGRPLLPFYDLESFVASLERPRSILLMIKAGEPIDDQITALAPLLDPGDVIIDGGNSLHSDTERRCRELETQHISFVGAGISGGEDGARFGPSIMPGGNPDAWPIIGDTLTAIAADKDGESMAAWIGPGGSGHYVKMVHNGIEYGDMQVIAEAYDIMHRGLTISPGEMRRNFHAWNEGKLGSYLIEITADILGHDDADGPTLDVILDSAGQKGTGKWAVNSSMDHGVPVTLVGEAVYARFVSSLIDERRVAGQRFDDPIDPAPFANEEAISDLQDALYASKIVSYAQGFMLLDVASDAYDWGLDIGTIAGLWRAGCIIRSRFLDDITAAYREAHDAPVNLLLDDHFSGEITAALPGWRRTVARAATAGIPTPAYGSALAFFDAYRSRRLPANLIQAQRDYFGAHTYERVDRPRGEWFHTDWTGHGGTVTSGRYDV